MTRVLLIEDDDQVRALLKEMLIALDVEVVAASDGIEGLRLFRFDPFDIVVTDILMPNQEGLETIGELKREAPDVKIIAISGGGSLLDAEDVLLAAQRIGAQRTLSKPFRRADLEDALNELLESPA